MTPKVDIVEVVAAAAAPGVVKPVTMHTTAAFKARGVLKTIFKLGEEYVGVIVPVMEVPALVHVAVRLLPVKEVKPDKVTTAAVVADAPVNLRVTVEAVDMTLLENATEAEVKAPANTAGTAVVGGAVVVRRGDVVVTGAEVDGAAVVGMVVVVGEYADVDGAVDAAITPEHTLADAVTSALVATATTLPAVAAPMVKP